MAKTAKNGELAPPSPRSGHRLPIGKGSHKGGKPGRSGRPPVAFKNFLAQMRQNPAIQREFKKALADCDHKHWPAALKVLTDYDDEMPANLTPEERAARITEILKAAEERRRKAEA